MPQGASLTYGLKEEEAGLLLSNLLSEDDARF